MSSKQLFVQTKPPPSQNSHLIFAKGQCVLNSVALKTLKLRVNVVQTAVAGLSYKEVPFWKTLEPEDIAVPCCKFKMIRRQQ